MKLSERGFGRLLATWLDLEDDRRVIEVARMLGLFQSYGNDRTVENDDAVHVAKSILTLCLWKHCAWAGVS